MAKRSKAPRLPKLVSAAAQKLFDRFPVARGDDTAAYEGLVRAVMEALEPRDFIEEILARDVADHTWLAQRFRNIETILLTNDSVPSEQRPYSPAIMAHLEESVRWSSTPLEVLIQNPGNEQNRARLEQEFIRDHPEKHERHLQGRKEFQETYEQIFPPRPSNPEFKPRTISTDDANRLAANAFKKNSREIDLISRQVALSEARRNVALRELERYQAVRRARAPRDEILDAEYTEAPPPTRQRKP